MSRELGDTGHRFYASFAPVTSLQEGTKGACGFGILPSCDDGLHEV